MPYRQDIDGLRGIAVLAVILFHFGFGLEGGYAGVDVFFVISGFLIGGISLRDIREGRFSLLHFWTRRIRRLFAALFCVVLAVAAASYVWMVPTHLEEIGKSILAQPALVANIYFFQESGYFETASEYQPLLHTWSLAVEEQFYLFFPLVFPWLVKRGKRFALVVLGGVMALSLAWSVYGSISYQSFTFYLIPSRAWELGLGVMLALLAADWRGVPCGSGCRQIMAFLGIGMIIGSFFMLKVGTPFPGWVALFPCLGTVLCLASEHQTEGRLTVMGQLLSLKPLVYIGRISYSLYLWHWPVNVFFQHVKLGKLTMAERFLELGVSLVLATISYRWIEQPVRSGTVLGSTKSLLGATAAGVVMLGGIGLWFSETGGVPGRVPAEILEQTNDTTEIPYYRTRARDEYLKTGAMPTVGVPPEQAKEQLLVWGDSHLSALLPVLAEMARERQVCIHVAAQPGTPPLLNTYTARIGRDSINWGEQVVRYAREKGIRKILLHARWSIYTEGPPDGDMRNLVSNGRLYARTPQQAEAVFRETLPATLKALEKEGLAIFLMDDVPFYPYSVPEMVILASMRGQDPNLFGPGIEEQAILTARIDALIAELCVGHAVTRLDPDPYLLDEKSGRYALLGNGKILYTDQDHLSPTGSRRLRRLLEVFFP